MKLSKVMAVFLVLAVLLALASGCSTQKPSTEPGNTLGGNGKPAVEPDKKSTGADREEYVSQIDLYKAGLGIDSVDEKIIASPKGNKVAFIGSRLLDEKGKPLSEPASQLFVADLTTGEVKSLEKGWFMRVLEWSPDGKYIVYRNDIDILTVIDADGGKPMKIGVQAYAGSVSPDSSQIAYVKREKGIFIANIDGSNEKQVTNKKGDWYPIWYPDGKSLFYFNDRDKNLGDGAGQLQGLACVNIETGKTENLLAKETGKYRRAHWIVPGKSLYIEKGWDDGYYEMMVDVEQGKITDFGESPFGIMRAAVDKANGLIHVAQKNKVKVYDSAGKEVRSFDLPKPAVDDTFLDYYNFAVSPKGDTLAYLFGEIGVHSVEPKVKGCKVWVVDADGKNGRELTENYRHFRSPVWLPKGDAMALIEDSGAPAKGEGELFIKVVKVE